VTTGRDAALAILALAGEQHPSWPAAYLLGLAVGALQEEGATLDEIERWVAKVFDASSEDAADVARDLEPPPRASS